MAWNPPTDLELAVTKPVKASNHRRIRDLVTALANADSGAPQIVPEALDFSIEDIDPANQSSVVISNVEPDSLIVFDSIVPDIAVARTLEIEISRDGGSTYSSAITISSSENWRSGGLGCLSGFIKFNLVLGEYFTHQPSTSTTLAKSDSGSFNAQLSKPLDPIDTVRVAWSAGSFGSDANQLIRHYTTAIRI